MMKLNHMVSCHDEVVACRQPSPSPSSCLPKSVLEHLESTEALFRAPMATPSPTNHYHQRLAPELVSILATSSPEMLALEHGEKPKRHYSLKRQTSSTTVLDDFDFNDCFPMTTTMTTTRQTKLTPAKRHLPRVSISPPRVAMEGRLALTNEVSPCTPGFLHKTEDHIQDRSPLDDITRSLCRVRLTTPSSTSSSSSSQRSTPSRGPTFRKPSHRRVSFDMLPSPSEIGHFTVSPKGRSLCVSHIPTAVSPVKGRKHRRNTTVILLSSRK